MHCSFKLDFKNAILSILFFLRTSPCFLQHDFLECYDKLLRNSLCKVSNVRMDDNQFLQAVLLAAKGGLGVSSARLLALPIFLATTVGAKKCLERILWFGACRWNL